MPPPPLPPNWPLALGLSVRPSIVLEIMNKRETVVSLPVEPARREGDRQAGRQAGRQAVAAGCQAPVSDLRSINKYLRRRRMRRGRDNGTEQ